MTDRVDLFAADIAASADALERQLRRWRPLEIDASQRFAFVGLGSSRFAADVVAPLLRAEGRSAWVEIAGSGPATSPAGDVTLVAISASGGTPEVVAAAERHRGHGRVIGVTGRPDSALAAAADEVVPLGSGQERAGIACRSFRATIAALALSTGLVSVEDLRPAIDGIARRLCDDQAWVDDAATALDGAAAIDLLADGSMLGVAQQGALMLREAPRLSAHAWATTEWPHTGVYLAWPGRAIVLYPGSAADDEIAATARRRSTAIVRMPASPLPSVARAIVDSVAMESVAAALWRRARAIELKAP